MPLALVRPESLQPSVQRGTRTQNDRLGPCPRRSVRIWPPRLIPISTNSEHSAWGPPSLLATTAYQRSTSAFGCKRSARFGPPPPGRARPGQAQRVFVWPCFLPCGCVIRIDAACVRCKRRARPSKGYSETPRASLKQVQARPQTAAPQRGHPTGTCARRRRCERLFCRPATLTRV